MLWSIDCPSMHIYPNITSIQAVSVAHIFFDQIFKLHGMPQCIVCNRDPTFTSAFWKEIFWLNGVMFNFSSSYHHRTDGQIGATNWTLKIHSQCFTSSKPKEWVWTVWWIPWAEYSYNTSLHSSTGKTPFEIVYGRPPPNLPSYVPGTTQLEAVEKEL